MDFVLSKEESEAKRKTLEDYFKWRQRRRFHGGKTRELWLKKWINTNFLHKMANAHKKVIWIKKISLNDEMLSKEAIIKECGL